MRPSNLHFSANTLRARKVAKVQDAAKAKAKATNLRNLKTRLASGGAVRGVEQVEEGGQGRYEVEFVANSEDDRTTKIHYIFKYIQCSEICTLQI